MPVFPHIRQPGVISQLPASLTPTMFCKKLPNPGGDFFAHIPQSSSSLFRYLVNSFELIKSNMNSKFTGERVFIFNVKDDLQLDHQPSYEAEGCCCTCRGHQWPPLATQEPGHKHLSDHPHTYLGSVVVRRGGRYTSTKRKELLSIKWWRVGS